MRKDSGKYLAGIVILAVCAWSTAQIVEGQPIVPIHVSRIIFGAASTGVVIRSSTGTPEAAVTAPIGSVFLRSDGGAGTAVYVKESGSGNTGWAAYAASSVTASSSTTFTNKTLDAEGTGNLLTLSFTEWWPGAVCQSGGYAAIWDYGLASGSHEPTPSCQTSDPNLNYTTADFLDTQTDYAYKSFLLPSDWTGTVQFSVYWWTNVTTNSVVWQLQTACTALTETIDPSAITFNAAQTVTDAANGTTATLNVATFSSVTTTGCSAGELMWIKLFRDPTNGSDTLAATARMIGGLFTYRRAI